MVDHADEEPGYAPAGQGGGSAAAGEAEDGDGERVAKALARAGVASRRDVERYIAAGRVARNGKVLDTPAVKVSPGDILTVDGEVVDAAEPTRLWRYHKPVGLLTSHGDPQGRPTVFAHLPEGLPRVISVGRLDIASEGLLLLTNDGELSRALELPNAGWRRTYRVRAYGRADQARLDRLRAGATVEGVRYGPIEARIDKATGAGAVGRGKTSDAPANLWLTVTVEEGKNREVRRVLESVGLKVNRLIRLAYGPFALGSLAEGQVEEVGPRVIREQLAGLIPEAKMPRGDRRPPTVRVARVPPPEAAVRREPVAKPRGTRIEAPGARPRGKPGPRPQGAAGRVAGAWTPPAERKGPARPGGKAALAKPGGKAAFAQPGGKAAFAQAGGKAAFPRPGGRAAPLPASGPAADRATRSEGPAATGRPRAAAGDAPARGPTPFGKPAPAKDGAARPRAPQAGRGGAAKPASPAKSTGMELTPPMRRSPRRKPGRKGAGRPPRGS